ncbi:MAG: glycosyltransferase family 39 protein [Candidatus Promineofilum sp.]|nr:glycosyltransferase family 39 protein [Promineifilum sp.]
MAQTASDNRASTPAALQLRRTGLILLVLLTAAALRLLALPSAPPRMTGIPPGMTHDEADHGLTAWQIVNGAREVYFPVGYGREPLYDYATALVMSGTGPTILAARLTSVYFSLVMIAAVYAWARRAFGRPVALLAAAGLAVGFWPVMAGRQALRSIALPAVFALASLFFWRAMTAGSNSLRPSLAPASRRPLVLFAVAGLLLGLAFYTYIPARIMWPALPALAVYLAFTPRAAATRGRLLGGTVLTLLMAAAVAAPLFVHLANNPGLEVRIDELSAPLRAAADGDFTPLWANARGALRLFTLEGDQTWRYNIPGKPFLGPLMGLLFYLGLLVAGWLAIRALGTPVTSEKPGFYPERPENRFLAEKPGFHPAAAGPGAFLALVWLALGFAPVLVTGPGLSMTQAIGVLPVLYVFPALALAAGYRVIVKVTAARRPPAGATNEGHSVDNDQWPVIGALVALALFATVGALTARDYFGRWANAPEVRVQYETTMVTALRYLDRNNGGDAAISTITPGRYHTPAVALLTLHNPAVRPRWFDGRQSLILPGASGGTLVIPGFAPLPAELQPYVLDATLVDELPLRPDDLDRPLRIYALDRPGIDVASQMTPLRPDSSRTSIQFGDHALLLAYDLAPAEVHPGDTLALVTVWQLEQPLPDASLFAHVVGPDGRPIAVADSLGAPGESWVSGDILLQLHTLLIPLDAPAGEYPLVVGLYTRPDGARLTTTDGQSMATLTRVTVTHE